MTLSTSVGLAALVFVAGVALGGAGPVNGDAAVYAAQARAGAVGERWTHAGYVALLMTFGSFVDVGVAADLLSALSCAAAVLGVGRATGPVGAALVAGALLPLAPFGEVDAVWFALLALGAHAADARVGGMAVAAAVAVSPTALAGVPWGFAARPDARWLAAPAGVVALVLASGGDWLTGTRGVLTGGWVPDPVGHLPWLILPVLAALPGLRHPSPHRAALPWAALGLLAPGDVPGELILVLALAGSADRGGQSSRAVGALLAAGLVLGGVRANVARERVARETQVVRHVARELGSGDALVAPWSWGARVAVERAGAIDGVVWTTPPVRAGTPFCRHAPTRVAWLPPGARPPGSAPTEVDAWGVHWLPGEHPAATQGCW